MEVSFEQLLGKIAEGIAVSDPRQPDNPLVYVNPAFCQLTGYAEAEVLGRNCRFLQGPDTDQHELDRLRLAINDCQPCIVELVNYRKDGTRFWNNLSINPMLNAAGEVIYFTGIQLDVTRRKLLEEKQRQFVNDLAHELKTPIAALMGLTDTLERQPGMPDETRRELTRSLQAQIKRLGDTVESILDMSRIDYGQLVSARQLLDLHDIVLDALDATTELAQTNSIALIYEPAPQALQVLGDPWTLTMLAGNLLSNAIKYSDPGESVTVRLLCESHTCQLQVVDHGHGIDSEHLERIFERFYRIDQSRSRQNGGTGLGLAIVSEVARQHGGHVHVASQPGHGSVFTVTLPWYTSEIPG